MFQDLLRAKKISVTKQRLLILETLEKIAKPTTIEGIKKKMEASIDTATLYRSLSTLVDAGLVYQTDFREGAAYYELQINNHHHHLVCTECKKKESFAYCPQLPTEDIEKETGFVINNHIFEVFGLCKNCTK